MTDELTFKIKNCCANCGHYDLANMHWRYKDQYYRCTLKKGDTQPTHICDQYTPYNSTGKPTAIIKEIIKEVPVEVIKEVEKIVEVIKEVEKIVEVPVVKEVEIEVERPVWQCPYCEPTRKYKSAATLKGHITKTHKEDII